MLFQPDRNGHPFNGESSSGRQLSTAGRIFMAAAAGMQHSPAGRRRERETENATDGKRS
jgi:hypothetical protein